MYRRMRMGQEVLLQMTDICKEFPGVKALDHVSLTVKKERYTRSWERTAPVNPP